MVRFRMHARYMKIWILIFISMMLICLFKNISTKDRTKHRVSKHRNGYVFGQPFSFFKQKCSSVSPLLRGPLNVNMTLFQLNQLATFYPAYEMGGHYTPEDCISNHKTAIVVPYKNRSRHLRLFLNNLHFFLRRQQLDYVIFVVEPMGEDTFNRAKLMNIGYLEAMRFYPFDCFVFHDVDLIPMDDRIPYTCHDSPAHLSRAIDKFHYGLPYLQYFGGVCAFATKDYRLINGASNRFWGWGGEDDELLIRTTSSGFNISRPLTGIARYRMLRHRGEKANPLNRCRFDLLRKARSSWRRDGLKTTLYDVISIERMPTFTHVKVDLKERRSKFLERFTRCKNF